MYSFYKYTLVYHLLHPGTEQDSGYVVRKIQRCILTCATTWMDLEDLTLSERSQSQRTNSVRFHVCGVSRLVKFLEAEKRAVAASGCGEG